MSQKRITLIVSDLHMGDGGAGDDFVDDRHQFASFLRAQAAGPEGRAGEVELIVNGDFLEMVQVLPHAYKGDPSVAWCSEAESVEKLECIMKGHPLVFDALAEFQAAGNQVTLFPGNHDVDLYWPDVRAKLQARFPAFGSRTKSSIRGTTADSASAMVTCSRASIRPTASSTPISRPSTPIHRRVSRSVLARYSWSSS